MSLMHLTKGDVFYLTAHSSSTMPGYEIIVDPSGTTKNTVIKSTLWEFDVRQEYRFFISEIGNTVIDRMRRYKSGEYKADAARLYLGILDINMDNVYRMYLSSISETQELADALLSRAVVMLHNKYKQQETDNLDKPFDQLLNL